VRIWDVAPGYLNRGSLLGEHRELHGLRSILVHGKTGYSRHPETLRWVGCLSGLSLRHACLVAEMRLRGYADRTPVRCNRASSVWPRSFVTEPADQFALLRQKYDGRAEGRIPLPSTVQELWAQHRYSVMARSPEVCTSISRRIARTRAADAAAPLARELVLLLRQPIMERGLAMAVDHMWQHVRPHASAADLRYVERSPRAALFRLQLIATRERNAALLSSTALAELSMFV